MGARVAFEGRIWQVSALVGGQVYLAADDGATECLPASHVLAADGFKVVGQAVPQIPAAEAWASLPLAARERAMAWLGHIREVETGLPGGPGSGGEVRDEYDPQRFTLAEREHAKARELTALGWTKASGPTVKRMRLAYRRQGVLGLVDKRSLRSRSGRGRADERVVAAVLAALRLRRGHQSTTVRQIIDLAEQIVVNRHGLGQVKLPSEALMYRLVKALSGPAGPPGAPARAATGQSRADGAPPGLRPAERVHVATAELGMQVVDEDGHAAAVSVTAAVDEATGCVLAAVAHRRQAVPVQLSVLLAEMAVPRSVRPGWREMLCRAHESLPGRLMSLEARIEATAVRPAAIPETLAFDPATAATTSRFLSVHESLGVSLEAVSARKGGRAAAETVQVLAGLFTRHACAAALAARSARPGEDGTGPAVLSLLHLQDVLDEWISAVWHTRPQEALRHPLMPRAAPSPDEMWEVLLGAAVPLTLAGQHYGELFPAHRCALTESGIRLGGRRYDDACLDEHRRRDQRWEVHHHPYDVRQVYIRLPDGLLHPLPWTDQAHAQRPFDTTVHHRITQVLAGRTSGGTISGPGPDTGAGAQAVRPTSRVADAMAVPEPGSGPAADGTAGGGQEFGLWDAQAEAGQW
ncbi:transposase [Streptomyces xinghaiensis]|uniref:Transposase n=1 Tax=Streptomyces xinghaiensis TaxID=1038928 RepID=A0A3M8EYV4_9ACTN|nr:hypothetical protein BEN35_18985 [Streptomyces fradiae]PQM20703.1 transposase [Streptomyces xinghaiensis]RKM92644.1 transposase [Streptomyces xinghaiensis]RNC70612.1 transposase [Streptomyces xinghaiensis]